MSTTITCGVGDENDSENLCVFVVPTFLHRGGDGVDLYTSENI